MWSWTDGVAVITGGGGLLGRGMAVAFAEAGMDVVVADLDPDAARRVADEVRARGRSALALATDVSDPAQVRALADRAYDAFGKVSLLCNNAGMALFRPFEDLTLADWNRVLGVNLMGVIHGIDAFLPRMLAQEGPRHVVNTASMSGVGLARLRQMNAIYVTSKFAIVGLSETMAPALAPHGIGVSVLCPGMTLADPAAGFSFVSPSAEWYRDNLMDPMEVALELRRAIEENRLHVFPHHAGAGEVEARHALLMEGFRQAEATSPPLRPWPHLEPET